MKEERATVVASFDEESNVGRLTLNRPEALNALSAQMRSDIRAALDWFQSVDDDADGVAVRTVVIEGAGEDAFSAGADVDEFEGIEPGRFETRSVNDDLVAFDIPMVAKIDGFCLGGGLELALACDFRIASTDAVLGFPEVDLGLLPGGGGIQQATASCGTELAMELMMTGERLSGEEAADVGLVTRTVQPSALDDEVQGFASTLASKPPLAIRAIKDAVEVATETGYTEGSKYDRRTFTGLLQTADHREGVEAFQTDREPSFEGR